MHIRRDIYGIDLFVNFENSKSSKILCLENLLLYGMCVFCLGSRPLLPTCMGWWGSVFWAV